jgi:archaemetzincin
MPIKNWAIRIVAFSYLLFFSCTGSVPPHGKVIVIQPFIDFNRSQAEIVYKELKKINPNIILRAAIQLPYFAYYPARDRYRADSLLHYLSHYGTTDTILIGLTNKDISTTKDQVKDWGVMGLGKCPGNACIVSTHRLSENDQNDQLYKLALHELGHTQGLGHCKNKTCIMRDAEGGNHLEEEIDFCPVCKNYLRDKGWRLNQ